MNEPIRMDRNLAKASQELIDICVSNICEAINKQLCIMDKSIINETYEVVRNRIETCPLFRYKELGYKNLIEVSLEFDSNGAR